MSVQTEISRLSTAKDAIKTAIENKGVSVSSSTKLDGMATLIGEIQTGTDTSDANATASDILSGKTAYVKGIKVTGNIATKTASNLSASGKTVTVPAGYYATKATKNVATGSASTPATSITANPSISVGSDGLITADVSASKSVTPNVSAGYVASGAAGTVSVSGSATQQLPTQAAQTITPGTSDKTIAAGKYLTGKQTIKGDENLIAANIKKGVTIFGVTGTLEEASWKALSGTTTNSYINSSGVITYYGGNYRCLEVTVKAGDRLKLNAYAGYSGYFYAFYNSGGTFISGRQSGSGGGTTITDEIVTAPIGAVKLAVAGNTVAASTPAAYIFS